MKNTVSKRTIFKIAAITLFLAIPVLGAYIYVSLPAGAASAASAPQEVVLDLGGLSDGQARFFDYQAPDGGKIRYFVVRGQDGVIRAALDACDECWQDGEGHYQEGDEMVCRTCEKRFPLNSLNSVTSRCNPVPLSVAVANNKAVIDPKSLMEGRRYFAQEGSSTGRPQCAGGCCGGIKATEVKRNCCS